MTSPSIFIGDHSIKIRKRKWKEFPVHFMRLSHNSVGGVTTFSAAYHCTIESFRVNTTRLRRDIGSYVDYGYNPKVKNVVSTQTLKITDRLPLHRLDDLVTIPYPKHKSVLRQLNTSELSNIYGIKKAYHDFVDKGSIQELVPCQILSALLTPALMVQSRHHRSMNNSPPPIHTESLKGCWLPSLKRWLPSLWCLDAAQHDGAVKHDDSETPLALWNDRVTPLFPSFTPYILSLLRDLLFRRSCRRLVSEACSLQMGSGLGWNIQHQRGG